MAGDGEAVVLRFATGEDVCALRQLRADIFGSELKVQSKQYQDVFADAYSKNVVLLKDGRLIGAVRLAFSRDQQEFYISYLLLVRQYRNRGLIALLLGAVFLLMEANGLRWVRADAADDNLPMYLEAGCQIVGDRFRKYGFECEWTPVVYRLGTNPAAERAAMSRAARQIPGGDALLWRFEPCIELCSDIATYRQRAGSVRAGDVVPHLGPAVPRLGSQWVRFREAVVLHATGSSSVSETGRHDFVYFNSRFCGDRVIVSRRGSEASEPAKMYGLLTGTRVIFTPSWTKLDVADLERARNVFFIAAGSDVAPLASALADNCFPSWGFGVASNVMELSELLLRNFFEFLGPRPAVCCASARLACGSMDAVASDVALHRSPRTSLSEALAEASAMPRGSRSHCLIAHEAVPRDALSLLTELLSSGHAIGAAVERINLEYATRLPWRIGVIGDPALRFAPAHRMPGTYPDPARACDESATLPVVGFPDSEPLRPAWATPTA